MLRSTDRAFVGAVGFNSLGACSELAYHMRPEFWGRGLMAEAAGAALAWLQGRAGAEIVEAFVDPENLASVRVAERLGLRMTGEVVDAAARYTRVFSR